MSDPESVDTCRPWRLTSPTSTPTFPPQREEETAWERKTGSGNEWRERERERKKEKEKDQERANLKERWRRRSKVRGRKSQGIALRRSLFSFFCLSFSSLLLSSISRYDHVVFLYLFLVRRFFVLSSASPISIYLGRRYLTFSSSLPLSVSLIVYRFSCLAITRDPSCPSLRCRL